MRSEKELIDFIVNFATNDKRVRALLLNGSRADPNAIKDRFQDFDITCIVTQIKSFTNDHSWINVFGDRLILQMPKEMTIGDKGNDHSFEYLMLFENKTRIDLTLFPLEKIETSFKTDSLSVVLVDKDGIFEKISSASDVDYVIKRPTEKEFIDCCNEFWWVSTYVAKGLWRRDIIYAKQMFEIPVRTMFLKLIEWFIGLETNFAVSIGNSGRNMKALLQADLYDKILSTYPDSKIENIWSALFVMTELFHDLAGKIAKRMSFSYNNGEAQKVTAYLKWVYNGALEE